MGSIKPLQLTFSNDKEVFFTKFSTVKANYLFDAVTQNILQVDNAIYDLIEDITAMETQNNQMRIKGFDHSPSEKELAKCEIETAMKEGMLISGPVGQLGMTGSVEEIQKALSDHCQQMILEITHDCNLRCQYCAYSGIDPNNRSHSSRHMPLSLAKQAINFYLNHSNACDELAISFYGGEPLLRIDDIQHIVSFARKSAGTKPISLNLTTNGTLLTDDVVDFLIDNKFSIMISIDGPAEIHNRYRIFPNGAPTHGIILKNIASLQKRYPDFYKRKILLSTVLGPPIDYQKLEEFFSQPLFRDLSMNVSGVNDPEKRFAHFFNLLHFPSHGYERISHYYKQDLLNGKRPNGFLRALFEKDMVKIYRRKIRLKLPEIMHPNGICFPGRRRLFVSIEGILHACERINPNMPLGSINNGFDFEHVKDYIDTYRKISATDCCSCWAIGLCSMCFQNALGQDLSLEKKRRNCQSVKEHWKRALALYCSICEENPDALKCLDNVTIA